MVPHHTSLPVLFPWDPLEAGRLGNAIRTCALGGENGSHEHSTFSDAMSNSSRLSVFFHTFSELLVYAKHCAESQTEGRPGGSSAWEKPLT